MIADLDDRTLIYMLFDAVEALSRRVSPDLELHLSRVAAGPDVNERLPIGMFEALWAKSSQDPLV